MTILSALNFAKNKFRLTLGRYVFAPILNRTRDIRKWPKATGKLRQLQIADTLLLKIFHDICEKHGIRYFLKDGTLLGAVRHGGFIPWDDDLDTQIIVEDFDRVLSVLKDEFRNTKLTIWGVENSRFGNATLRISLIDFPFANLDIFYLHASKRSLEEKNAVWKAWKTLRKRYYARYHAQEHAESESSLNALRHDIDRAFESEINATTSTNATSFVNQVSSDFQMFDPSWIFPLKKIKFEDYEFYAPNDCDKILRSIYGDYMSFPPNFTHHGSMFTTFNEDDCRQAIRYLSELANAKQR